MEFNNVKEFYPTPETLLEKIKDKIMLCYSKEFMRNRTSDFTCMKNSIREILEPSAGKGNICDWIKTSVNTSEKLSFDCIEINPDLQSVLKGKGYNVVYNDFLTFKTYKQYDLIIMNPPFSNGSKHLLKALEIQKNGGRIICILNAETIKNPYSNERKDLIRKLENLNATIEYYQEEFVNAEHKTAVEIAIVDVDIPKKEYDSTVYKNLQKKIFAENNNDNETGSLLVQDDFVKQIIKQYELETLSGLWIIKEFNGMKKNCLEDFKTGGSILSLNMSSTNEYVQEVRMKYWEALFKSEKFTGQMTNNLREEYYKKVTTLKDYDFNLYNIMELYKDMSGNLIKGIEECIIKLFDDFTSKSYYKDSPNIHYYNGWKTNKAYYVDKKIVLDYMLAYDSYSGEFRPTNYNLIGKISDMEKALNYLDGGLTDGTDIIDALKKAEETGETKNIDTKYFTITFFKKGTAHFVFKDMELLKKFNIFAGKYKAWLPHTYGETSYQDMTDEEKEIVNSFDGGETEYNKVMSNTQYYIYKPKMNGLKLIGTNTQE